MRDTRRSYFPKSKAVRLAHTRSVFIDKKFKAEYANILKLPSLDRLERYWKLAYDWGIEVTDPALYERNKDYLNDPDWLLHQYTVEYPFIYGDGFTEYERIGIEVDIDINKKEFNHLWNKIIDIKRKNKLPRGRHQQSVYSDLAYAVSRAKVTGLSMEKIHQQLVEGTLSGYNKKLPKRFKDDIKGLGNLKSFFEKNYSAKTYKEFYQEIHDQD